MRFFKLACVYFWAFAMCCNLAACGSDSDDELDNHPSQSSIENGHEYVDLGLSVKWATCNVGATKAEDRGGYFAWGETKAKTSFYEENYDKSETKRMTVLDNVHDAATSNWGGNWRMPSLSEVQELKTKCTISGTSSGIKITGPNGNSILIPFTGYYSSSTLHDPEKKIYLWTNTHDSSNSDNAYAINFEYENGKLDEATIKGRNRWYGMVVRAVCK